MTRSALSRRAFCASAPAVTLAPALRSPAPAAPVLDPTLAMCAQWWEAYRAYENASLAPSAWDENDPACERAWSRMTALEDEMAECSPRTPAGIAAMLAVLLRSSADLSCTGDWDLAMVRSCERAAAAMEVPKPLA